MNAFVFPVERQELFASILQSTAQLAGHPLIIDVRFYLVTVAVVHQAIWRLVVDGKAE
jgi:hypothetical protein